MHAAHRLGALVALADPRPLWAVDRLRNQMPKQIGNRGSEDLALLSLRPRATNAISELMLIFGELGRRLNILRSRQSSLSRLTQLHVISDAFFEICRNRRVLVHSRRRLCLRSGEGGGKHHGGDARDDNVPLSSVPPCLRGEKPVHYASGSRCCSTTSSTASRTTCFTACLTAIFTDSSISS